MRKEYKRRTCVPFERVVAVVDAIEVLQLPVIEAWQGILLKFSMVIKLGTLAFYTFRPSLKWQ